METIIGMADAGNDHGLVAINQSLSVCFFIFFCFQQTKIQKKRDQPKLISILFIGERELYSPTREFKQLEAFRFI